LKTGEESPDRAWDKRSDQFVDQNKTTVGRPLRRQQWGPVRGSEIHKEQDQLNRDTSSAEILIEKNRSFFHGHFSPTWIWIGVRSRRIWRSLPRPYGVNRPKRRFHYIKKRVISADSKRTNDQGSKMKFIRDHWGEKSTCDSSPLDRSWHGSTKFADVVSFESAMRWKQTDYSSSEKYFGRVIGLDSI